MNAIVSRGGGCAVAFVFFLRAHFPRKVPHRFFVDSELKHRVDFLCFCLLFVLVHFLRESPPESVLPVVMGEMVCGNGGVIYRCSRGLRKSYWSVM